MDEMGYTCLPSPDTTLLDRITYEVPSYMKEDLSIEGPTDLDYLLYRYVKEMVYNHAT